MPNATVGADAPASPKSAIDSEISRLQCDKIVADVLLEEATARKKKAEAATAEAEEPRRRAFETILTHELVAGERRDSIILLSLASIKQDIHNLGLCNGGAS
jgi:hypothetical protein